MANGETVVGVPLIAPSEAANESPGGSWGETVQDVMVPPVEVGVTVVIVVPFVKTNADVEYVIEVGATSLTSIVMVAVSLPAELVAVTV